MPIDKASVDRWESDVALDRESRQKMIADEQLLDPDPYTKDEDDIIDGGLLLVKKLSGKTPEITLTKLETNTPIEDAYMCYDHELHVTHGKVEVAVHGANVLDVCAFLSDYMSRFYVKHSPDPSMLDSRVLERVNSHHQVWYYKGRGTPPFQNRDFVWSFVVKRLTDDQHQYLCVLYPTQHVDAPITSDTIRATSTRVYRLTAVSPSVTRMELFMTLDMKGFIPSYLTNSIVIPTALRVSQTLYFMQIKEYSDYDSAGEDAKVLGQLFTDSVRSLSGGSAADAALSELFYRTAAFRHLFKIYPWLEAMLRCIVENKKNLRSAVARRGSVTSFSSTPSASASRASIVVPEVDAIVMLGKALAFDLLSRLSGAQPPTEVVELWVNERKNIIDAGKLDPTFFRSFFTCVAKNLLHERSLVARLGDRASEMVLHDLDQVMNDDVAPPPTVDTSEKVSTAKHTATTNILALLISIPASLLLCAIHTQVAVRFPAIGGMWGDHHAIYCAVCMVCIEVLLLFVWHFKRYYVIRRLFSAWPVTFLAFLLISKGAFNNRPGHWTVPLMTVAWVIGGISTYPMLPSPRPAFFKHARKTAATHFLIHGGFGIVVFGQIIPAEVLSQSNGILTSVVTGIGFPFVTWIVRKIAIGMASTKAAEKYAKNEKFDRENALRSFDRMVKITSSILALTPCLLNYMNTSKRLAVMSASLQIATEVLGKVWIVQSTRKTFAEYVAALDGERGSVVTALTLASQEPGMNQQLRGHFADGATSGKSNKVDASDEDKESDDDDEATLVKKKKELLQAKLDRAMLLMAARWNAEIVAEKVAIIVGSLIAVVVFSEGRSSGKEGGVGDRLSTEDLILVACMFFGMEFVTDLSFVFLMDRFLHVPILSRAINESKVSDVLQDALVICLTFVAAGSCMKMASMIRM